ncbi:hypothetical protein ElyMa_001551900 [Elysia marginata]|uniref:Uncharacterized protein n=1 Tax=Elysia marginata TaxID=1093978 RepID=A0AAV4JBM6_9GAST|nr:hypothetical protein ElyMa_001551900 [Elysia marginata]
MQHGIFAGIIDATPTTSPYFCLLYCTSVTSADLLQRQTKKKKFRCGSADLLVPSRGCSVPMIETIWRSCLSDLNCAAAAQLPAYGFLPEG